MKKNFAYWDIIIVVLFFLLLFWGLLYSASTKAQTSTLVPFGDFEQWIVRPIKESNVIGGKIHTIYAIGKADTLRNNQPLDKTPFWGASNVYAKVMGIEKASGTVYPEKCGNGYCCRMDIVEETVSVIGIINLRVVSTGSIFTGHTVEPVTSADDPYGCIDFGVPFHTMPTALQFDYKCRISPEQTITKQQAGKSQKQIAGHDKAQVKNPFTVSLGRCKR